MDNEHIKLRSDYLKINKLRKYTLHIEIYVKFIVRNIHKKVKCLEEVSIISKIFLRCLATLSRFLMVDCDTAWWQVAALNDRYKNR